MSAPINSNINDGFSVQSAREIAKEEIAKQTAPINQAMNSGESLGGLQGLQYLNIDPSTTTGQQNVFFNQQETELMSSQMMSQELQQQQASNIATGVTSAQSGRRSLSKVNEYI